MKQETTRKPPKNGVQYSAENQPSGAAKSEGWLRKKRGKELVKSVLDLAFVGAKNSPLKKMAAEYFGVPEDELTVEIMMHMRQAEKAITKADTNAYVALMNRANGLPKQEVEVTTQKIKVTRK